MTPFGLGAVPRPKDERDFSLGDYQAPIQIPATFMQDVSAIPVKMQGTFGTCGAHAGSFFDSKLQTDKRGYVKDLSPKYLWKQVKLIDGFPLDAGTDMGSIFKSLTNTGDCAEALLPDVLDPTIQAYSDPSVLTDAEKHDAYQNDIGAYAFTDNPTWDQIRQAIYQNKAVLALVDCFDTWYTPSWAEKDILPLKIGNFVGHHFIALYAYDEQYVYFRNSWSNAWGRNGDGYFDTSYVPHVLEIGTAIDLPAPFIFTTDLSEGMTSNDVLQLQKRLNENAATQLATSGAGSPGQETTYYGPVTEAAVKKYQTLHNIPATGLCGPLTRAALNTSA